MKVKPQLRLPNEENSDIIGIYHVSEYIDQYKSVFVLAITTILFVTNNFSFFFLLFHKYSLFFILIFIYRGFLLAVAHL